MPSIKQIAVPTDALLSTFHGGRHPELWSAYRDCYAVAIDGAVSLVQFVNAFYTTPLFRIERWLLGFLPRGASTDAEAAAVAAGTGERFAVWSVGARTDSELLMCDRYERTRSWFRVVPGNSGGRLQTTLYFGSGVAARRTPTGGLRMGAGFGALLAFHRVYSRLLLGAAWRKLAAQRASR
jgi:hypothetical protein